jgi:hypothetical protein
LRSLHRRLNLIVFPNPEWQEPWGGCRELESDPWRPKGRGSACASCLSRTVAWFSRRPSPFGMASAAFNCPPGRRRESRRSIAVYSYTRQRAGVETAPSHSTIYVPRPMGAHLQPGYTLQPGDVQEPEVPIGRLDYQIRYLYRTGARFLLLTGIYRSP